MPSVLVVDDDRSIRDLLMVLMRRQGYHTAAAENGREAINVLQQEKFDAVLLDLMMPEISGYGVLDFLKEHHYAECAIIVSATKPDELDRLIQHPSVFSVISKPFAAEELIAAVDRCVAGRR